MKTLLLCIAIICSLNLSAQIDSAMQRKMDTELSQRIDSITKHSIGKPFAPFTAASLDGKTFSEKQLIGKVTLVNFWFESCPPCIRELESLKALHLKYENNPTFQLISFSSDYPEIAREVVQTYQIPYIVCPIDRKDCYRLNMNSGFPTNMIVNQEGKIAFFRMGGGSDKEEELKIFQQLEQAIVNLLNSN